MPSPADRHQPHAARTDLTAAALDHPLNQLGRALQTIAPPATSRIRGTRTPTTGRGHRP
ncbi:hypothetical protein ACTWJ8_40455 (plasmid) [Streptomyces sp. SDT5-1]|uniref:hypothetical protein n=1 Tax=Streptomyces sp. SDT5-1 TaxID=3406418 RepID=UPI003FCF978A